MKYLKLFEELKKSPQVGDYIICTEETIAKDDIQYFIQNNVGQVVAKSDSLNGGVYVTYDNIPQG